MPKTTRSNLTALEPNLENQQVANPELLQTAITHLFDVMDAHMDEAAAHGAANLTYTGVVGGGTVDGALTNVNTRVGTLESMGLGPSGSVQSGTVTLTATAAALPGVVCVEVLVQSDPANAGFVYVGSLSAQALQLAAGDAISLKVSNLSALYAKGAASGYVLNYLVRG